MQTFKGFLTEAKLKAEDYEAAIVMGWYVNSGSPLTGPSNGITDTVYSVVQNNPSVLEAGKKIAAQLLKLYPALDGKKAEQYGRAESKLTSFWSGHGATDTTPKTDIIIGNMRLSLKMEIAQLMSGGKNESTATYYAALKNSDKNIKKDPQFTKVTSILESFVTSTLAPSKLRPIIKAGTNPVVNAAEKAHKDCMKELGTLFENNRQFKIEFAREAMSGYEKYGSSAKAAAEWMLIAKKDGSAVSVHNVSDDSYCEKIADRMKLQARFKTSSRKLQGKKTGEYNFWSVVSLIVDAMDEEILHHGNVLTEIALFDKIKKKVSGFVTKMLSKVKSFISKGITFLMKFLGLVPSISVKTDVKF
tara:strand:- start:295 stop:1374 length:1080 start_codon:yes stop_codon:yes gene_type:complete